MTDLREVLKPIRCFFLDMDGTFYLGNQLIEGSLDFLDALKRTGRGCLFLTNNSSNSAEKYVEKLKRMGVPETFCHVLTSGQAAARYIRRNYPGKKGFWLANQTEWAELRALGIEEDQNHPDYVLITFDTELDYRKLTLLCAFVRRGLPYIATHPDFNCPTENGFIPDIGATIAYVKASTGREPDVIIGKPYPGIMEEAMQWMQVTRSQAAMAGDRLYTDIAAGKNSGINSILVFSGETTREMAAASSHKPDIAVNKLSDLIPYL